uniref:Putative DegT/DnrJ/EryC1/StrS family aminotransferase n=1 Tax=Magnetococcus massalia (strain MO-1) TaxID=451514 RepID=A0A1S7LIW3_MAGMO|nr:putative DegT/DnrJ/EryC1/StrS family aminotransferase [Candidatus Magnetococcus massalia]
MSMQDQQLEQVRQAIEGFCHNRHKPSFEPHNPMVEAYAEPYSSDEVIAAVNCLLSGDVRMGGETAGLEHDFATRSNSQYGLFCNSGASAKQLCISALCNPKSDNALQPGDEVIVSALAWPSTVWPLIQNQLVPVVVDVQADTLNMTTRSVEAALSPRTRAVFLAHQYGNPCEVDAFIELCKRHELTLLEDCSEANGARYRDQPVGSFGAFGLFSFYHAHHLSTIEGGMVITRNAKMDDLMRILRAHGWVRDVRDPEPYISRHAEMDPQFLFVNQGYNMRPTDLQAVMGRVQLGKLQQVLDDHHRVAARYAEGLNPYAEVITCQRTTEGGYHAWFGFPLTVNEDAPFEVGALRQYLQDAGVECRPISCGNIARQPGFKYVPHRVVGALTNATRVMYHSLSLPVHKGISSEAADHVVRTIQQFMQAHGVKR